MSERIQTGDVEPIQAFIADNTGRGITGRTDVYARLRRESDGQYLDWNDLTFKASGWTTLSQLLSEVDATNAPGLYEVTGGLDTGGIVNPADDDSYLVFPLQSPGTDLLMPPPGEIRVGQWVDNLDEPECHLGVAYENATTTVRLSLWLTRSGAPVTSPTSVSIDWYNQDGTLLFNATDSSPDSQGVFFISQDQALQDNQAYYAEIAITDAVGTVTTNRAIPTVG